VTFDDKIFVLGGIPGRIDVYHPDTDSWTTAGEGPVRLFATATVLDSAIYLIGGAEMSGVCCIGPEAVDAVDRLDPLRMRWESMRPMLEPRSGHGAAVVGNSLYVMGGSPYAAQATSRNERFTPQ
jgi:N-acetylneuraminic acid mutarotase